MPAASAHTCSKRESGGRERKDFPAVHSSELFVTNLQSKTHQLTRQQQSSSRSRRSSSSNNSDNPRCVLMSGLCRVSTAWDLSPSMCTGYIRLVRWRRNELISIKKGFSFVIRKLLLFCCCCEWNASMNIKLCMQIWTIKWDRDSNSTERERAEGKQRREIAMRGKLLHSLCCCPA